MKNNPAVVGLDEDTRLRDGNLNFGFTTTNWPRVRNGDEELDPTHGFATGSMKDGVWAMSFVHLFGRKIGARGKPIKGEIRFSYSFDTPVEDGETWHPDYAPPEKLVDFVAALENRLSGRTEA